VKKFIKVLKWSLVICLALIMIALAGSYFYLRSTLPLFEGQTSVAGISKPVEIIRDSYGMAHIYAQSDADAYFASGYCAAQDRIFQMDILRRAIRGRLAEILGEKLVPLDRFFRTVTAKKTLDEMVLELPPEIVAAMTAYADGVNAFLNNPDESLPLEFTLLGADPEPWLPADCLAAHYFMSWGLNVSFGIEMMHAAVIEKVGPELASTIFVDYPKGYPVITEKEKRQTLGTNLGLLEAFGQVEQLLDFSAGGASNSWVISGQKSKTGKPILANDMHLGHTLPGIWYEIHLNSPGQNVSGVTLASIPFIVVGANEHVAWGFTNSMIDDTDYYVEKINPANPDQVEYQAGFEDIEVRSEIIKVRGGSQVEARIRLTRHGPIISDLKDINAKPGTAIAMRWTASELFESPRALYLANRARNISEVEQAAAFFKSPGQNWVFADDQGNIGYMLAAGIPDRQGFDGGLTLPGWDGKHEWSGFVPTEQQPRMRNPAEGFIATANNKIVSDDYPHKISHYYAMPDRIQRIRSMLEAKEKIGIEDIKKMHADFYVVLAEEWVPLFTLLLGSGNLSNLEKQALAELKKWDFVADPDDVATTIFHATVNNLIKNTFMPRMGEELFGKYVKGMNRYLVFNGLRNLVSRGESAWFDNPETKEPENLAELVTKSFKEAVGFLKDKLGNSVESWVWGELHTLTFYHPVGRYSSAAGWLLNAGPFPMGGSFATVNPAPYPLDKPWEVTAGTSQRMIIDFAKRSNSLRVIPSGISGNFMSSHYDDQVELWRNVEYRPFVLTRQEIEQDKKYVLKLVPK